MQPDKSLGGKQGVILDYFFLGSRSSGNENVPYTHATARAMEETDWTKIVSLYDSLMLIRPPPIIALNRAIAIGQRDGPGPAIEEIQAITGASRLMSYAFYWAALGEFELRRGGRDVASEHFRTALARARNVTERRFLEDRLAHAKVVHTDLYPGANPTGGREKEGLDS